ncbi:acetyl-CoA acetyltransferase [Halalkalicoccus paucihalophilus]|uniref:Acetyl-CoA acetyltransferase n=1 Tax=Halalkalicoccus paucihalophilus TaxID=1008153 RepID=A0A151AC97_9EURY|nr:thiolase family protein [Halalkalicoccus paucihalophilus]KYH24997.1 acetyl-CoA acetyltransferase [Halalkalicoccus paucihalophilus]
MTVTRTASVAGIGLLPNGTYSIPERELAIDVIHEALEDAAVSMADVDGLYMPSPRPWTKQKFFSTNLLHLLGLEVDRTIEVSTGGTSGGKAFQTAVSDVRSGAVDTALVFAVERNSVIETTGPYFDYILSTFDANFESPIGMSIPGVYAQSMQRYCHEYDVKREDLAEIVVKNRDNAAADPDTLFDKPVDREAVLGSRPIADPIRLYECPAPCDGGAALVVTSDDGDGSDTSSETEGTVEVAGLGSHHAASHLLMTRDESITELPAVRKAAREASRDGGRARDEIDVYEPYAPFPHIEAIITEELGLVDRGAGLEACLDGRTAADGEFPISPSGGCLGRGHPPMVTPLYNYVEAVRQLRGTASTQVLDANYVLTTSEHGHVNGATATVFAKGE